MKDFKSINETCNCMYNPNHEVYDYPEDRYILGYAPYDNTDYNEDDNMEHKINLISNFLYEKKVDEQKTDFEELIDSIKPGFPDVIIYYGRETHEDYGVGCYSPDEIKTAAKLEKICEDHGIELRYCIDEIEDAERNSFTLSEYDNCPICFEGSDFY